MATDARSEFRNYPIPHPDNTISEEFARLAAALELIDIDVDGLLTSVSARALLVHTHAIADVTGLQSALDGKQSSDWRPALDDLTNVNLTGAANGQFLGRIGGVWVPVTVGIGNVSGLQTALDGKAAATHPHAISDVTGLQTALDSKAATSFRPPLAEIGGVDLTTAPVAGQALVFNGSAWVPGAPAGADPWASQPIGVPIPLMSNLTGVAFPPTDKAYRYIRLTAGLTGAGQYNNGCLSSETVSGSDPLVQATANVSLTGSPLIGQAVRLINTERRSLRGGSAGTVQNDATQRMLGQFGPFVEPSGIGVSYTGPFSRAAGVSADGGANSRAYAYVNFDNNNASGARTDTETRSKNIGVEYVMRIL